MRQCFTLCLLLLTFTTPGLTCTSAVISGKATDDGRPLLWKHRDTGDVENKLVFIEGSKYDFVGVANRVDTLSQQIWMGSNEVGFAIMNTASYNLNQGQVCDVPDDQEGLFMRAVLEVCSDLDEFEAFMDNSVGTWGLAANFGVIDAKGGAAYYEKGYYDYTKYDVGDSEIAPEGYLIRTNFSMSGTEDKGYGFIRHGVTSELFEEQEAISVDFMLQSATRNLKHGLLEKDLRSGPLPADKADEKYVLFQDYVVRPSAHNPMDGSWMATRYSGHPGLGEVSGLTSRSGIVRSWWTCSHQWGCHGIKTELLSSDAGQWSGLFTPFTANQPGGDWPA